jgi:hypothetical protein
VVLEFSLQITRIANHVVAVDTLNLTSDLN